MSVGNIRFFTQTRFLTKVEASKPIALSIPQTSFKLQAHTFSKNVPFDPFSSKMCMRFLFEQFWDLERVFAYICRSKRGDERALLLNSQDYLVPAKDRCQEDIDPVSSISRLRAVQPNSQTSSFTLFTVFHLTDNVQLIPERRRIPLLVNQSVVLCRASRELSMPTKSDVGCVMTNAFTPLGLCTQPS